MLTHRPPRVRRPLSVPLALVLVALAVFACKKQEMFEARSAPAAPQPVAAPASEAARNVPADSEEAKAATASAGATRSAAPPLADAGRKLIKTVDLSLRVKDTKAGADRLRAIAAQLGGFVSGLSAERRDDVLYYSVTLRVPVDRLEPAVQQIEALADRVERESVKTEDVTDRWVDLDARVTTLKATENELRELLAEARQRGKKVADVMEVYDKLTEIRISIEQIEREQKTLQGLSSLSTVNVELSPVEAAKPIADRGWSPGSTIRESTRTLVHALQGIADVVIVLVVVVLPIGLAIVLPVVLLALLWRRLRARGRGAD